MSEPCANPDCSEYPYYGVAPHECYFKRGPDFKIGQSLPLPRNEWPKNFRPDPDGDSCGMYYCPVCLSGMPSDLSHTTTPMSEGA